MLQRFRSFRMAVVMGLAISGLSGWLAEPVLGQGSVGTGRLPRTSAEIRRTLKTILIVREVKPNTSSFTAKDEITNDELTYKVSRSTKITVEKGLLEGLFKGKKELQLADLQPGQRLEVVYRESLPTQLTNIKVLKPKA